MRGKFDIPEVERKSAVHGEHYRWHGKAGTVLCGAGNGGVWVRFDGQGLHEYVGVPIKWLTTC